MLFMSVAVIADIVGSRGLPDRAAAQRALEEAIARVERDVPLAERQLTATVGDELQGVYPSLDAAMAALLLIRLALPDDLDCRFGIGIGAHSDVPSRVGTLAEGRRGGLRGKRSMPSTPRRRARSRARAPGSSPMLEPPSTSGWPTPTSSRGTNW
jgi:hypothetical protein